MAQHWKETVTIELGGVSRQYRRINTTRDAAHYLVEHWPGQRDAAYKNAVITCSKALKGEADDDQVLGTFVQAATNSKLRFLQGPSLEADPFELELMKEVRRSLAADLAALSAVRR